MAQVNFDWITGTWHSLREPDTFVMPAVVTTTVQFIHVLIDSSDLESKEDSLRVERVVGNTYHLYLRNAGGATAGYGCELYERIYVTDADGVSGTPVLQDAYIPEDFDRSWKWQRRRWITDATKVSPGLQKELWADPGPMGVAQHPFWTHLDLPMKARLRDRNVLVYHVTFAADPNAPFQEGEIFYSAPELRVGVKF